jgi:hypothetical protein
MAKKNKTEDSEVMTFEDEATEPVKETTTSTSSDEVEEIKVDASPEDSYKEIDVEEELPPVEVAETNPPNEEPSEAEESETQSNMVDVVYLGISEKATVVGKVTGTKYTFIRDVYGMCQPTPVDEQDLSAILSLRGKACCGKDPNRLFATKTDWDVELEEAKRANQ